MKNNLFIKIVLATIACFFVSYSFAQFGGLNHDDPYPQSVFKRYLPDMKCMADDLNKTQSVVKRFDAKELQNVDLTLIATDVEVSASDTETLEYHYEGVATPALNDKIDGNTLTISEIPKPEVNGGWKWSCGPGWGKGFNFNFHSSDSVKVFLKIPKFVQTLKIHTVSGDIHLNLASLRSLELKSVSGDMRISGNLAAISAKTVSGDLNLNSSALEPKIEIASTSGDVHFIGKTALNATFDASSVSGDIKVREGKKASSGDERKSHAVFGNGKGLVSLKSVSGEIELELK